MKIILAVILVILIISFWGMSQSEWHIKRNQYNELPKGNLTFVEGKNYKDTIGQIWILQPAIKNKFHQPAEAVPMIDNPYPNLDKDLKMDPNNPNLKFLCKTGKTASFEVILQPNGKYLLEGSKKGTYNYGHPSGLWGIIKHTFLDVIPHFFNSKYE